MLCSGCALDSEKTGVHYTSWRRIMQASHRAPAAAARNASTAAGYRGPQRPEECKRIEAEHKHKRDANKCLKGTIDCLSGYELTLDREWQVSTRQPGGAAASIMGASAGGEVSGGAGSGGATMEKPLMRRGVNSASVGQLAAQLSVLDTLMETVSFAIESIHQRQPATVLGDRSWWGMGTIGNKFLQAHGYYELVQKEARAKARTRRGTRAAEGLIVCEVGLNAGHSAVLLLEAAGANASLVMFDLGGLTYTQTARQLVHRLYPGQMEYIEGDSRSTTPAFAQRRPQVCDVMSIDGNHAAGWVERDLRTAQAMSKPGALVLLDDMVTHRPDMGRPAVEEAERLGVLSGLRCTPDRVLSLPLMHRFDQGGQAKYVAHAWCHARFADHSNT